MGFGEAAGKAGPNAGSRCSGTCPYSGCCTWYDAWCESKRGTHVNAETLNAGDLEIGACDIVIDALTGIGLSGPARVDFVELITLVNDSPVQVLSLDVPSGVDADTGSVIGSAIHATTTMTFIAYKPVCSLAGRQSRRTSGIG